MEHAKWYTVDLICDSIWMQNSQFTWPETTRKIHWQLQQHYVYGIYRVWLYSEVYH